MTQLAAVPDVAGVPAVCVTTKVLSHNETVGPLLMNETLSAMSGYGISNTNEIGKRSGYLILD